MFASNWPGPELTQNRGHVHDDREWTIDVYRGCYNQHLS